MCPRAPHAAHRMYHDRCAHNQCPSGLAHASPARSPHQVPQAPVGGARGRRAAALLRDARAL
eukprot:3365088-Prymnesium_polylepis.2